MPEKTRILFVDDEQFVLHGLQRQLRNMRTEWDMVFVDSPVKGLEAMAHEPFDVVVTDMRMPGMNGAEFLSKVMACYPATIRLVLSGHADQELILQAEGAAHQFLAKPCDPAQLRSIILGASALGKRLRRDEIRSVLGGIARLPVIPCSYSEIMDLLSHEDIPIERIGEVVSRDPGMTANILKLVNSAHFGLRQQVSDPSAAIAFLLGLWGLPGPVVDAVSDHHTLSAQADVTPALIVHAMEALSAAHGDCRVFGVDRSADPGPLAEVLGPRLEVWRQALERKYGGQA